MPCHFWKAPRNGNRLRCGRRLPLGSLALRLGVVGLSVSGGMATDMATAQTVAEQTMTVVAPPSAPVAAATGAYALGIGDTVAVMVFDHADFGGQFLIGPDGTFRHPLVGAIPAAERTREAVEGDLKQRLAQRLAYDVHLSVDVAIYRPVYVIGDVVRPGELAYTPGLLTFTALAKAGGVPSVRQLPPNQLAEAALAERDLRVAEAELCGFLLRRAALDAALSDAPKISMPPELRPMAQSPLVSELLIRETALLEGDRTRMRRWLEMTRSEQDQLETEIAALTNEQGALAAQAKLIDGELQNMLGLARKGLVTSERVLDLQRFKADNEADRFRMASFMSRARQQQTELETRLRRAEEELRQDRLRQRLAVETDIERARARIDGARTQLALRSQVAVTDQMLGRSEPGFTVTRNTARGPQVLNAATATPLHPGDVLEVRLAPAFTASTASTGKDGDKPSAMLATGPTPMVK